ncbi:polysaccharide biosynthesis protein [Cognataquiflexum rubidum]|uniref:polysaccharide biosynthesis protein n=1 Tax=Cognataquiflexum rubidum TaxID=2922273 RepID=UPI001F130B7D|nr:polysaccharide biosynthesis protein [Cognataquiflexum rubidum]
MGKVLSTGMSLRKKFAIGSLLLATPVLVYLLRHHEASWLMTILIVLSLIPAFFSALSGTILQIPLTLRQDIKPLQKNQVGVNLARLAMLLLTIFIFPWAFIAILAAGIPQIKANIHLRKLSLQYADWTHSPDPVARKEIMTFVKRLMPDALYYCLSGQITIWLISIFGSTEALAQIGALTRLTAALSIFSIVFHTLMVPRFARLENNKPEILKKFIFIQIGLIVISLGIVFLVKEFAPNVLWILGNDFSNLTIEVVFITLGSCISLISGLTHHLLASRGIIVPPVIFIFTMVMIQVGFAFILKLDTIVGVLHYAIITASANYLIRIGYLTFISIGKKDKISL